MPAFLQRLPKTLRFHQEELFAAWEKAMEEQEQYEQSSTEE